jgi:hypothetical protein
MTVKELKKELNKILKENPEAKDYEVRVISYSQVGYCTSIDVYPSRKEIIIGE